MAKAKKATAATMAMVFADSRERAVMRELYCVGLHRGWQS
jgi:hypothetical protein